MKTVLGMFAVLAVAANLLTATPAMAQDKKPMEKKPVTVAKKHTGKKMTAKKMAKSAKHTNMAHAKKK